MIIPIRPGKLFELNPDAMPVFDGDVVYIDDVFKNYHDIVNVVNNTTVEIWKASSESRNFIDYYDCRTHIRDTSTQSSKEEYFRNLIKTYFGVTVDCHTELYTFNYYKNNLPNLPASVQHHPHFDHKCINVIFYLDTISNGGTALYETNEDNIDQGTFLNNEHKNLHYDISQNLKIKKIIEAKPNRCVIFDGNQLHGGYIADHSKYRYDWRINAAYFLRYD